MAPNLEFTVDALEALATSYFILAKSAKITPCVPEEIANNASVCSAVVVVGINYKHPSTRDAV